MMSTLLRTPKDLPCTNRQAFPWGPSQGTQGTDYTETDKPSPGALLRVHRGTDYTETDKPSPGAFLRVYRGTDYTETNKPSPGAYAGGQTTHKADKPSPRTLLRVHQGTDYTETDTSLPLGPFSGYTRGQTTQKTNISGLIMKRR